MQALATAPQATVVRTAFPRWLLYLNGRGCQALRGYKEMEVSHPNTPHQRFSPKF